MQNVIKIVNQFKDYVLFLVLFIISLVLIYNSDTNSIGGFRSLIIGGMGWSQDVFTFLPNPVIMNRENRALRDLNLFLSNEITKARIVQLENEKLRNLLDFKQNNSQSYIPSEIVGKTNIASRYYFVLDKGSKDGIQNGMVTRTDAGLVGIISETSDMYSIMELIRNKHINISVKIVRNGIEGILSWSGKEDYFTLKNIPVSYEVLVGDELITSDFSNRFPREVPVGKIKKVNNKSGNLFYQIDVKPYVDFNSIQHLFVINEVPDTNKNNIINAMIEKLKLLDK